MGLRHQSYTGVLVAVSFLGRHVPHPWSLQCAHSTTLELWCPMLWKTSLLKRGLQGCWAVPRLMFKRTPMHTQNGTTMVFSRGDWQLQTWHGMSLCQQPVESCSDVANPLGNRAMAGSQCLMTQLSPGVVVAVEGVVLFFNSFVQPMDQLDGILPRPVVRRNYNTKIFWGWASRDCKFCVGADGPGGFSFAIRTFTSSSKCSFLG